MGYIVHTIEPDRFITKEINEASFFILGKIRLAKLQTWEHIGMMSPVSDTCKQLVMDRLKKTMEDKTVTLNELIGHGWRHNDVNENLLREKVLAQIESAQGRRKELIDEVTVGVPNRNLNPDL